jgi:hypothetical protein
MSVSVQEIRDHLKNDFKQRLEKVFKKINGPYHHYETIRIENDWAMYCEEGEWEDYEGEYLVFTDHQGGGVGVPLYFFDLTDKELYTKIRKENKRIKKQQEEENRLETKKKIKKLEGELKKLKNA